jgi:hypothetical protein
MSEVEARPKKGRPPQPLPLLEMALSEQMHRSLGADG